jgi:hypothetical protein
MYGIQKFSVRIATVVCVLAVSCFAGDDDFFDKNDLSKKTSFEKRLYYGLERTEGLSAIQKDQINKALKEFQFQKDKQNAKNAKKFQSNEADTVLLRNMASNTFDVNVDARVALLGTIHKTMNVKQREQFIKKFQGTME